MEYFDLPIIRNGEDIFNKPALPMDDYLRFIEFALKYIVDIEAARKEKKELAVNVPFSLK